MKMFSSMRVRNPEGLVVTLEALLRIASLGPVYDLPDIMRCDNYYRVIRSCQRAQCEGLDGQCTCGVTLCSRRLYEVIDLAL